MGKNVIIDNFFSIHLNLESRSGRIGFRQGAGNFYYLGISLDKLSNDKIKKLVKLYDRHNCFSLIGYIIENNYE